VSKSRNSGKPRVSRHLKIALTALITIAIGLVAGVEYASHRIAPLMRQRVVDSLSNRFNSQVQLQKFHLTFRQGLGVEGEKLSLRSNLYPDLPPQIGIGKFSFHAGLFDLFRSPMRIGSVKLQGLTINLPPKNERAAMPKAKGSGRGKISIVIDRIVCDDALLLMMTDDPKKTPLEFDIHALTMQNVGANHPMKFKAELVNPKPIGNIATAGNFGPWNSDEPHSTHVDGTYSFTNADLSTTHGITGILSSKGKYSGPLDTITVDGETDTPDFSVDVSGHELALHTDFHAIVNGTNGNTYLEPVRAHFLNTDLTANGQVVRGPNGKGHDITLDVVIGKGRIEDLLQMGASSDPVMTGAVHLKTKFHLPTGDATVGQRLHLQGTFQVDRVNFTNSNIKRHVDELSLRGQGKADQAKALPQESSEIAPPLPDIPATLQGTFSMANRKIVLPYLEFKVPGADIQLAGKYSLDGNQFDFAGHARLQAHISGFVGGWKGKLLTPLDPFFAKNGAGTDVPIKITGTKSNPNFGLNF